MMKTFSHFLRSCNMFLLKLWAATREPLYNKWSYTITEGKTHQVNVTGIIVGKPLESLSVEDTIKVFLTQPHGLKHHLTLNSTERIQHHMIEEQSWMSWQLGREREEGMETEKLSSHLAQNRRHNKSLTEQYTVLLGLDSPNHVVSSLLLAPKRRRAIGDSHLYLNMCILRNMSKVFFLTDFIKRQPVPQYFLNL